VLQQGKGQGGVAVGMKGQGQSPTPKYEEQRLEQSGWQERRETYIVWQLGMKKGEERAV
jgi:hypothetical protein